MRAETIARSCKGRRSGRGWVAYCPVHEGDGKPHRPSLSIAEQDGKVLLRCHAGCEQRDVIDALKARGLWEPSGDTMRPIRRIVAEYNYTDERGDLLYQVVRYEPKDFRQRYPDGRGGWIWKKYPRQVLYHLPEVLEAAIVFVVEGEKDAESLRSHGFVATTVAGGCNAPWLSSFTETLAGRETILIPDNDEPGRQRVLEIARALLGHAALIRIQELKDPRAKDVSDWFALGHSELELIELIERKELIA